MPQERLSRLHSSRKAQAAFLVNSYDLIVTTLNERGARADESSHFEQLLDSVGAAAWAWAHSCVRTCIFGMRVRARASSHVYGMCMARHR